MRRIFEQTQKVEIVKFIEEFVNARQGFFTPGKEELQTELPEEKNYVWVDKIQLEQELDALVRGSLESAKVFPLQMKITVKKVVGGVSVGYEDNGAGTWRNRQIVLSGKTEKNVEKQRRWGLQVA